MPFEIPVKALAFQSFPVVLDDVQFILKFIWNDRESTWRMDILDATRVPLLSGLKLVPNRALTFEYKGSNLPQGIIGVESETANVKPTFESLGSTMKITYFTKEEIDGFI